MNPDRVRSATIRLEPRLHDMRKGMQDFPGLVSSMIPTSQYIRAGTVRGAQGDARIQDCAHLLYLGPSTLQSSRIFNLGRFV